MIGLLGFLYVNGHTQMRNTSSVSEGGTETTPSAEDNLLHKNVLKQKVLDVNGKNEQNFLQYRDRITSTLDETLTRQERKAEFQFNPIKSLNGNIKFGGFYNGGVDLFTAPDMYIKPFEGISIYAIRRKHIFVPLEKLQENLEPILIQTVCLAAIENAVNYFTTGNSVLNGLLNFALKNGFTYLSESTKNKKNRLPTWESYYFSIGIRF